MKTPDQFEIISEEAIDTMAVLFEKDYSTDALSFIHNHHRIVNYWGDGVDLLPTHHEEGKRRRFSFFDLVWLGIVNELRGFGVEKEKIAVLKGELLSPPDYKEMTKFLKGHRKDIEEVLAKNYGTGTNKIRPMLEFYLTRQLEMQSLSHSFLALYIFHTLGIRGNVRVLVSKTGSHQALYSPDEDGAPVLAALSSVYQSSHISLSIREVISFFVAMPYIKDTVKQKVLSEKEWKLIELVREFSPKAVKVHFNDQAEITLVEMTRKKKVSIEARLTEIIVKGGYERIEIVTQNGQPVYYESTEKIKL